MMFQKVRMEMSSSVKRMVLHGESKLTILPKVLFHQNLFSIEKLLSSKFHMITCSKRDRLLVRPKMSRVTKCNTKTP